MKTFPIEIQQSIFTAQKFKLLCKFCHKEFYLLYLSHAKTQKFCSRSCYWKSKIGQVSRNKKESKVFNCIICGKTFTDYPSIKRKFCSYKCYWVSKKGKKFPLEVIQKAIKANKGRNYSLEHRKNISLALKGKSTWNKGGKLTKEWLEKCRLSKLGKKNPMYGKHHSKEHRRKVRLAWRIRRNIFGKGGLTPLRLKIRGLIEYHDWRKWIFERDKYTCVRCKEKSQKRKRVYLHAHHNIKSFSIIFAEFLQEYNQFSPIEDKETLVRLAITYKPFWDVDNGITLCYDCHCEIHPNWKLNKRKELYEDYLRGLKEK